MGGMPGLGGSPGEMPGMGGTPDMGGMPGGGAQNPFETMGGVDKYGCPNWVTEDLGSDPVVSFGQLFGSKRKKAKGWTRPHK